MSICDTVYLSIYLYTYYLEAGKIITSSEARANLRTLVGEGIVCLSVCLSMCLSFCLSVCLSVYLYTYSLETGKIITSSVYTFHLPRDPANDSISLSVR